MKSKDWFGNSDILSWSVISFSSNMAMRRLNPCYICGCSLRAGVLFLSILYMFASLGLVLYCVRQYSMHAQIRETRTRETHTNFDDDAVDLFKYLGVFGLINIVFYLLLWHGAIKKSRNRCLIWLSISTGETSILLARILFYNDPYYKLEVGMFLFNLYSLWVVWEFARQLLQERNMTLPSTSSDTDISIDSASVSDQEADMAKGEVTHAKINSPMALMVPTKKPLDDDLQSSHGDHPYYGKPLVTPIPILA